MPFTFAFLLLLFISEIVYTQNVIPLKLEDIMQGEDFIGHSPQDIQWSIDSKKIYFSKKISNNLDQLEKYKICMKDSLIDIITPQTRVSPYEKGVWNRNFNKYLYSYGGDLYLYETTQDTLKRLTQNLGSKTPLRFADDENGFYYTHNNNVYYWNLEKDFVKQLTDFKNEDEPKPKKANLNEQWLRDQQEDLFEIIKIKNNNAENIRIQKQEAEIKTIFTGKNKPTFLQVSPDGNFIFYSVIKTIKGKVTEVPDFMDTSGYVSSIKSRAKVGTESFISESFIYDRERDTIYRVKANRLSGIRDKPQYLREYHQDTADYHSQYDYDREVQISQPIFNNSGRALVEVKSYDHKDRWIAFLNILTGELEEIDRQRDEAWIGGPGIYSNNMGWLNDDSKVWFLSEKTGYSHIFMYDCIQRNMTQLTQGLFEILEVKLSQDGTKFYVTANAEGPHEHHYYHIDIESGHMTQITQKKGGHEIFISPDEKQLAMRYSNSNTPWELYIMENREGATSYQLTHSTTPQFRDYSWQKPEIIWFQANDGVQVPARIYKPKKSRKKGKAVIFVHGAGYLQNVHHWWSSYHREYMFHHFLVEQGYMVLDIDYRGSKGYGRDWRTAIYRHMGGRDLQDHLDGAQYLIENHNIDKNKIGIYGGSYGGFITLMALFTSPSTFRCGAALRSVTDWAHYNHGYTSRILNTPASDPMSYKKSSPIYFADGLRNDLLILHGMVDVNVQFQDVVRLSQKLIELKKDKWEMAVFPVEDHGFRYSDSWLDEYKRIYALFEKTLK